MKKYLNFVLAVILAIFLSAPIGMASDTPSIKHYAVINNTGSATHSHVGVTIIYPGKDRILGFTVSPVTSGTGTVGGGLFILLLTVE